MSRHTHGRATVAMGKNSRSHSASSTVLVNLDVYIVRATIGRDISADDDDLIVLFRRNSKEVTSEPTRWHADHIAEWNQHVGIQTSLLRNKHAVDPTDYLAKDYEIVLVALPSHSAVALFTLDFAQIVQNQRANRPKPFRISPTKCRDLAATLEFEVVWEYASPPPPLAPSTPTSSSVTTTSSLSMAGRRTNVSVVSMSSQNSELPDGTCSDCRSLRRRLERKEMQIHQLENFLKESQKRIDSLVFENEELLVREQAETKNAGQYRALNMRLLQELEMAFQFCAQQMLQVQQQAEATGVAAPPQLFMFLPQFEFMERVKKFHADLDMIYGGSASELHDSSAGKPAKATPMDAWKSFDFREEMESALERNQRLQHQLEFLSRSLVYEGQGDDMGPAMISGMPQPEMRRKTTNASSASDFSITDLGAAPHDDLSISRVAPVRTVTEQLNALERENFLLKAKLESAMNDVKSYQSGRGGSSPSECAETATSESSLGRNSLVTASLSLLPSVPDDATLRLEVDQLRDEKNGLMQELEDLKADIEKAKKNQLLLQRESMTPPPTIPVGVSLASPVGGSPVAANVMNSSRVSTMSGGSGTSPGGSDFLNKIYMDVGKAKVALEEKVKLLTLDLMAAQTENQRLQEQLKLKVSQNANGGYHTSDDDVLSDSDDDNEPKIVEILSDDEDEPRTKSLNTTATRESSSDDFGAERAQLEAQIAQLQQVMEEKSSQIKVQEQELQFMKQHLTEKAAQVTDIEAAKVEVQKELDTTKQNLTKAEKKITALEIKIETLQVEHLQQRQVQEQRTVATKSQGKSDDDVAELTKQLKLARQEVMQLRYRSNNLESVHEKLEEALKEKKTLQVKLTALEGQLYEQRSRTISGSNFSTDGVNDTAMIEELTRQLDQKSAQLMIAQREVDSLRRELTTGAHATAAAASAAAAAAASSSKSDVDITELEAKVAKFSTEIARLCERNDEQAARINALSERVEKTNREKYELEGIMKEILKEMDGLAPAPSTPPPSTPSTPPHGSSQNTSSFSESTPTSFEIEEVEALEEKPVIPVTVRPTGNKVVERYANALKTTFERRGSAPRPPAPAPSPPGVAANETVFTYEEEAPPVTKSKVAHLIKNFSTEEVSSPVAAKPRRSTLTGSIKKITKIDFRQRQGSEPSS